MDDRYTTPDPAHEDFPLLDELPAVVTLLIVMMGVAAPLVAAFLLAV